MVSFPEFKVWSLWSLLHFKLKVHSCSINRGICNLNRWPFNLDPWRTHQLSPSFKLWARELFPSSATHTLSWCMVKVLYCFHAIGLLNDKIEDHNVALLSRMKMFQHFSSSSSFKNDKQTSHRSFPLGPFLQMKEKSSLFSSLNGASSEKVIVASNSYIWYCTYILNAMVLWEMLVIYTSICNKL